MSVQYPNLVQPNGTNPSVNRYVFANLIGICSAWNPDLDVATIQTLINNKLTEIVDFRTWYGLFQRGQIATVPMTIGGSVTCVNGSYSIAGTGTSWTPAVIGQQFRVSYNSGPLTITALDQTNQVLTLEMPWYNATITSNGYIISQMYYSLPGIKYIHTAKNTLQAWRLRMDMNQQTLDSYDPWRIATYTPSVLAQMPTDANGNYQVELWPIPQIIQALPYIAVIQPPLMVLDTDPLPPYIRGDIIADLAISDCLTIGGPKQNRFYDASTAKEKRGQALMNLNYMAMADENLYRQNIQKEIDSMPEFSGFGAYWNINHGVAAGTAGWGDDWISG